MLIAILMPTLIASTASYHDAGSFLPLLATGTPGVDQHCHFFKVNSNP
jgi:hypothetical protein